MIVKSNMERMKVIPIRTAAAQVPTKLKGKTSNAKNVILFPGANYVKDEDWEMAMIANSASLERSFAAGDLELVAKKTEVKEGDKKVKKEQSVTFAELKPQKAKSLIKDTNDLKSIEQWLKEETRDEIRATLRDRAEEIKKYISDSRAAAESDKELSEEGIDDNYLLSE